MSVEINVTRKLDNNYRQVEISTKNVPTRYFKVHEAKIDEFCRDYKQFNKDQSVWSAIRIATPTILLIGLANIFTKNVEKTLQWAINIGVGIVGSIGTMHWNTKKLIEKEDKLLQKHNASEFYIEQKKLPFLNKSK